MHTKMVKRMMSRTKKNCPKKCITQGTCLSLNCKDIIIRDDDCEIFQ